MLDASLWWCSMNALYPAADHRAELGVLLHTQSFSASITTLLRANRRPVKWLLCNMYMPVAQLLRGSWWQVSKGVHCLLLCQRVGEVCYGYHLCKAGRLLFMCIWKVCWTCVGSCQHVPQDNGVVPGVSTPAALHD